MSTLARIVVGLLCGALLAPSMVRAQAEARPRQFHARLATSDGVRATLYRYLPAGGVAARTILLLPDVGTTRHAFEFDGRGLAPFLQRNGWEVYVVEYRGSGRSEVPFGGYRLEDLLDKDVEAAFSRALLERDRIAVGGVGLGATFALMLASRHPDRVSAVVALQPLIAPDVPSEPVAKLLAGLDDAPPWIDLPVKLGAPLFGARSWFEVLLANDGSLRREELTSLRLHVVAPVPASAARQLAAAMASGELRLGGVPVGKALRSWKGATLVVFAPRDNWVHPEFATPVRDLLGKDQVRVRLLDVLSGAHHDSGHLGMLLGREAPLDVFTPVARFLDEVVR